jgi:hypothetical protein
MIPIIVEFFALTLGDLQPVFFRKDVEFPIGNIINCEKASSQVSFVDSGKDWKDSKKQALSHGNRLCHTKEIERMYEYNITINSLVFAGSYIPTCSKNEIDCSDESFDFANAFVGELG